MHIVGSVKSLEIRCNYVKCAAFNNFVIPLKTLCLCTCRSIDNHTIEQNANYSSKKLVLIRIILTNNKIQPKVVLHDSLRLSYGGI